MPNCCGLSVVFSLTLYPKIKEILNLMKKIAITLLALLCLTATAEGKSRVELWPDGTPMDAWFHDTTKVSISELGRKYVITDYGVTSADTNLVQTQAIQNVIDQCSAQGGGVVIVPRGTFLTGALFFKPGTHLYLEDGGRLKGSDRIADFPIQETRIEGQTCQYFSALINAEGLNGFTIAGPGTIDGNGENYWREFWIRRKWNPKCTNKDAQRPRLVYISHSQNVTLQDVRLVASPFWTTHLYKSDHVRYLDCYIWSSTSGPVKGPSTDAIDIDVCHDILIHGCYMNVNDDAVAIKGGKGTFADQDPNNGPTERVLIENCHYGTVHGCLTLGSESLHDRNIVLRNCHADQVSRVLWLKMRPDTPQHYQYVTVDGITGNAKSFIVVRPWTQFFEPQKRDDMPLSQCDHIVMKNIRMECDNFFNVGLSDKYRLTDFSFINIDVKDKKNAFNKNLIENTTVKNIKINGSAVR